MAPAQCKITDGHVENEVSQVSQQGAGPGPASLGDINEEWKDGDSRVRLPKIDLRQPKRVAAAVGAKAEVATRKRVNLNNSLSLASSLSIPPQPPRVKLPPQAPVHDDKQIISHHNHQPLQKVTRSPFPRGTRGRGDPRNARMRAERLQYEAEQLAERQTGLSSKII